MAGNAGGFNRVVFATSYPDVIPWLSPDWVVFADTATLVLNPAPVPGPAISIDWSAEHDGAKAACDALREAEESFQAQGHELLSTPVHRNSFTEKVTDDFDFTFAGSVSFRLPRLDPATLPPKFRCGLLVGGVCVMMHTYMHMCTYIRCGFQQVHACLHACAAAFSYVSCVRCNSYTYNTCMHACIHTYAYRRCGLQ